MKKSSHDHQYSAVETFNRTPQLRRIKSELLLEGAQEIVIDHNGKDYRLRHTKLDKLILTK